ncbi:hypothetical protein [Streptomyces fungicidicus]
MAKKKRSRRRNDHYQLPPRVAAAQRYAAAIAAYKPRPPLPQRRLIAGAFGLTLLCLGMALSFWIPARTLTDDLRANGVTAVATVIGVDDKPKYVKVKYVLGPRLGKEAQLSDYAGMFPDLRTGDVLEVMYDPEDPSRVLPRQWVIAPPLNLPAYGTAALTVIFLGLSVAVMLRRRWILRTSWPEHPAYGSGDPRKPDSTTVRLTKP